MSALLRPARDRSTAKLYFLSTYMDECKASGRMLHFHHAKRALLHQERDRNMEEQYWAANMCPTCEQDLKIDDEDDHETRR